MVNCQICGKEFKRITHFHLAQHGVELVEYRNKFPDAEMGSLEWKRSCRESHLGKPTWNKGKTRTSDPRVARWLESSRLGHFGQIAWNKGKTAATDARVAKSMETRRISKNIYGNGKCEFSLDREFVLSNNNMVDSYDLTSKENKRAVICGMLLGDAGRKTLRPNMYIGHSFKQSDYILFKAQLLEKITGKSVFITRVSCKQKDGKIHHQIRIYPKKCDDIYDLVGKFYASGKKNITKEILDELTLPGLAIWYMDDGSCSIKNRNTHAGARAVNVTLNTYLPIETNRLIADYFRDRWGIDWYYNRSRSSWRLGMGTKEARKFFAMISPYIIPTMRYKLRTRASEFAGD